MPVLFGTSKSSRNALIAGFSWFAASVTICWGLIASVPTTVAQTTPPPKPAASAAPANLADDKLVAWCIVPFDAKKRGPAERAAMVKSLGLRRIAYDWRDEHVATFEEEILEYRKNGLEYFAFWGMHDKAFELFAKYDLHPQIWLMPPNPNAATQEERVAAAVKGLLPAVERTKKAGCKLGLYNHGGWGGEPENMVAICAALRKDHQADHVGIVYNLHHGHDHLERMAAALAAMKPYLICLNLNGMEPSGDRKGQKILQLGAGSLDLPLLKLVRDSGYSGPIGVIGHTQDDVELRLRDNLDGLHWLLPQLAGRAPGPKPAYRTPVPAPAAPPPPAPPPANKLSLVEGRFGTALDVSAAGALFTTRGDHRLAPLTVELWAKLNNKDGFNILVASEPKSSATHWEMYSYAGSGVFSVYMPGRGGEYKSEANIADGRWHHVAMSFDTRRLQLYVDGAKVLDRPLPETPVTDTSDRAKQVETGVGLGRLVEGGLGCAGSIDEVRFRTGAHAVAALPTKAPVVDEPTIGLWRFDSLIDGTSSPDESPRKNSVKLSVAIAAPPEAGKTKTAAAKPKVPEHWGKGQVGFEGWEDDWVDKRWQQAEIGEWLGVIPALPQGPYRKAVNVRVGENRQATICFDTQFLSFRAAWQKFLEFNPTRFGIISPPKPEGDVLFSMPERAGWNAKQLEFQGMHAHASRVVFQYRVDGIEVRESPWCESNLTDGDVFERWLEVAPSTKPLECVLLDMPAAAGERPAVELLAPQEIGKLVRETVEGRRRVTLQIPAGPAPRRLLVVYSAKPLSADHELRRLPAERWSLVERLSQPGAARWKERLETSGKRGADDGAYVVDTYGVPFDNPYKALMFTSGHDFLSNGDLVVSTVHGDVWRVRHLDANETTNANGAKDAKVTNGASLRTSWQRIATGLHQPLGVVVRRRSAGDEVFVLGRDQITKLHDRNGDGETDYYECFSNAYPTSAGGHDYITCLEEDSHGGFFFVHANLGVVRVAPDGRSYEVVSSGLRNPNGMGLGPGDIVTAAPQEGEWTPASAIYVAKPGAHFGYGGPKVTPQRPLGYDPPVIWIPRRVDNSSGGQTWVTSDRWGPLSGHPLHLSFGQCSLMLLGGDKPGGDLRNVLAACLTEFPFRFDSGAMRGRFSPHDGQLYVTGLRGWTSAASVDGCLQRVRYTGRRANMPVAVRPHANGVAVTFSEPLDKASAESPGNYHVEQWNYRYSQAYGSPELRVSDPKQEGRDEVRVRSATLLEPRTVFLEMKKVEPVDVLAISCSLRDDEGQAFRRTTYATIHVVDGQPIDESRLVRRKGANDEEDADLRPGLIGRYDAVRSSETAPVTDTRIDRMAALSVAYGESPTPFLPPGRVAVRWEGFLRVPLPMTVQFRFQGNGSVHLVVNEQVAYGGRQGTVSDDAVSIPVALQGGLNKVRLVYHGPINEDARFRWLWESAEFATELVPPTVLVCRGDDPDLAVGEQRRRGRELFASLRCAACHLEGQVTSGDLTNDAPQLAGAGRWNAAWIARWIADPQHVRPGTRMPQLSLSPTEAQDLAAWLANVAAPIDDTKKSPEKQDAVVVSEREAASQGVVLFEDLGCIACHVVKAADGDAFGRTSLAHVAAKYSPNGLHDFLRAPQRLHPTSRMPDFRLSDVESFSLASYLRSQTSVKNSNPAHAGAPERGAKLFVERGCVACHVAGEQKIVKREAPATLVDFSSPRGCVAPEPHGRKSVPWYSLTPSDRAALARFVGTDRESLGRTAPTEVARTLQATLRCNACHDRDSQRSPRGRILVDEGERGVTPESLPNLTWTGEKLHGAWMASFMKGERRQTQLRPWLKGRMPQFPAYAESLARGMAAEHGVGIESPPQLQLQTERVALGNELIQRSALDCRQCHAVGKLPAQGDDQTKIAPGINFAVVKERVRHDYYQRFTLDPPRFDVTTKMPKLAPDGKKTKVQTILDGDARQQFDAIWQYIQNGIPRE